MDIKHPTAPCICCYITLSAKQAINDKLQGSVAAYFKCGGDVNNQIKKGLIADCVSENFFKICIWQSYN